MRRACVVSSKYLTDKKRRAVNALLQSYRSAVNFYIRSLWVEKGKSPKRSKSFRKALIPWTYRPVLNRIEEKSQEYRVLLIKINPAYTSQACPSCEKVSKENRKGEKFCCVNCGYQLDADTNASQNILIKALRNIGSVESPVLLESLNMDVNI